MPPPGPRTLAGRPRPPRPSAPRAGVRPPVARPLAAFASDLDRTLVRPGGGVTRAARAALREARALGLAALLVSGREHAELRRFARRLGPVEGIVAENGAVVEAPLGSAPVLVGRSIAAAVRRRLSGRSWSGIRRGRVVVSVPIRERRRLATSLRGLPVRLVANVDRLMVLPIGVDKASGTRWALRRLGLGRARYAAIGDAENDLDLLGSADLSGAVRNAEEAVRSSVGYSCRRSYSAGVLEFVRGPLAARCHPDHPPFGTSDGHPGPGRAPR
ncbi:MAG TPA: HAD hydrolase family protein [Thermoplasmata archaeon]|nr:HAD hydrolase family protein [Thermoplasmata archaeon]